MPYITPCVKIRVGREWAKEPVMRPRRQIGPVSRGSVGVSGRERLGGGGTANPDHEISVSRVALYKRYNDRCGKVRHSGCDRSDDGDVRRVFELRQRGVVRLEDAEAKWETWFA